MDRGSFELEVDALFNAIDYDNSGYLNKKEYEFFLRNFYELATANYKRDLEQKYDRVN